MAKTILTLAFAIAAVAISVSAAGAVAEAAPVPALAQDEVFDYSQYETPPIWQEYKTFGEEFIPINQRPGGARGGDDHGRRRRSLQKRVVIHGDDASFEDASVSFGFGAQVQPVLDTNVHLHKRAEELDEDEQYVEEDEEQDEQDQDQEEEQDEQDEQDEEDEEDEEVENDYDYDADNNGGFEDEDEEREEEERRLDNEAGLQDWIDEMRSEEYRNLAGHPEGRGLDDEQYQQFEGQDEDEIQHYIEDEPQPSEEEIFAASWSN
ncbi:hypothetical protein BGZ72_007448 [Mortierella alpina]|nr:hypothetical protein BGZ72_007448 [Mortierella alpina]